MTAKFIEQADGTLRHKERKSVSAYELANLGKTAVVDHADTSPVALLAADADRDRAVIVVATCTESLGGGTPPTFDVGSAGDDDVLLDQTVLAGASAGDTFVGNATIPAHATESAILVTVADGASTPAGAFRVTVIAVPAE